MTLAGKRRFWMRLAVLLGVALFLSLATVAVMSVMGSGPHLQSNVSVRFPGFWSDGALLVTVVIAAPFVVFAAWKNWKSPDE